MAKPKAPKRRPPARDETPVRERILDAAFTCFMKHGYAVTSMLEIATRARVSKRELYAVVGNKEEMLVACIATRASRMRVPADLPLPQDRETLERLLAAFGAQLLREISDPVVIATFRLAIGEAVQAPEVARALDSTGREAARSALRGIMANARAAKLLDGDPDALADQFTGLLWGSLLTGLLLGVDARPDTRAMGERAEAAATAFMTLHPAV